MFESTERSVYFQKTKRTLWTSFSKKQTTSSNLICVRGALEYHFNAPLSFFMLCTYATSNIFLFAVVL